MSNRGLTAFLAGFGTGAIQAASRKREQERQDKIDKRADESHAMQMKANQIALDRQNRELEQDQAVEAGLQEASSMRVGVGLRDKSGQAVDVGEDAMKQRLIDNGVSEEDAAATAPIYAKRAGEKGSERWLSGSMDMGKVRPTSRADIVRTQGLALSKGNRQDRMQSLQMQNQADELDLKDLRSRVLGAQSVDELSKLYDDIMPDGLTLKGEVGQDGKFYKFTEDAQGNRANWETFPSFEDFKRNVDTIIDKNPDTVLNYWKDLRQRQREDAKDSRETKVSELQLKKYEQDIAEGKVKLEALPQQIQLDLAAKRANINQSNASAEKSRVETNGIRATVGMKDQPTSVKEALWYQNATPEQQAAFDKINVKNDSKVTSDGMGGFMINQPGGLVRMDADGNTSKVKLPDEGKPADVPKDWKKIGTSQGRPVYEDSTGKRFMPSEAQKKTEQSGTISLVKAPESGSAEWVKQHENRFVDTADFDAIDKQIGGKFGKGNIDLNSRNLYVWDQKKHKGRYSTLESITIEGDGKYYLIPKVSPSGEMMTEDQAINEFKKKGQYLGKFDTDQEASKYAVELERRQQAYFEHGPGRKKLDAAFK